MLTYPQEEEVGLLEASIRIINSGSIFEKLQLVPELHIKIRFQKTAVLHVTRKQQSNNVLNA